MSVNDVLQKLGDWSVTFSDSMPFEVMENIDEFGHIAFIPGRITDVKGMGDQLLKMARYVGMIRNKSGTVVGGIGMVGWLGDEDPKGQIYETPITFAGTSFADSIRALLPDAVHEGTLHSVAGTYNATVQYQDPRTAIDYVVALFGGNWRVNGDATLDAGLQSDLFVSVPTALIVRKNWGADLHLTAIKGDIDSVVNAKDFTTRVLLMGQGSGTSVAVGSADIIDNPYKDIYGNPVKRTRMVSESTTAPDNTTASAQLQLNRFTNPTRSVSLSTTEFDMAGDFAPGDMVWVFDPQCGLYDTANPVEFRGQLIYPVPIQVIAVQYPIEAGYTVAHRDKNGVWTDLSSYYVAESGSTTVDVGDNYAIPLVSTSEAVQPRLSTDTVAPSPPTISDVLTASYLAGDGQTKARFIVSWATPLNPDDSTVTDGAYYTVRYKVHATSAYTYDSVGWGTNELIIGELSNGTDYDISVEAVDLSGNHSGYDTDATYTAEADNIAPSTPAAPTVAGNPLAIQVSSNLGKASGGTFNLENDLAFLFVYSGTVSTFTPSSANYVGRIPCGNGNLVLDIPAIGSFTVADGSSVYVKITAVDSSGNESSPSTAVSATALLIDTINVSDAAITNAKIEDVSATKLTAGTIGAVTIVLDSGGVIESNGFTSGSVGWAIDGSGNAEFYNATVRGVFESGTSSEPHVLLGESGSLEYIQFETASSNQVSPGHVYIFEVASGSAERWALELKPPTTLGPDTDTPFIQMVAKAHNDSVQSQMVIGADGDTQISMTQGGVISLQSYANQYILVENPDIQLTTADVANYIYLQDNTQVRAYFRSSGGYVDARIPNVPPSSTDVLMRWATSSGQIWYDSSSARFKHEIRDLHETYDVDLIDKIRPVSYRENDKMTGEEKPHDYIGLVAEELAAVIPALVARDQNGNPLSVHYDKASVLSLSAVQLLRREMRDVMKRLDALDGKTFTDEKPEHAFKVPRHNVETGAEFRLPSPKPVKPKHRVSSV